MRFRLGVLPAFLLLLFSCSQSSVFLGQVDDPAQVELETIPAGSVVGAGTGVPIAIDRDPVFTGDSDTADSLTVELLDEAGTVLAEQVYEPVDDATELPPVVLPEIVDGFYQLRSTYRDGDEIVTVSTVPFYVANDPYEIDGLTSYPASSYPEADGLLGVSLNTPAGADPYLVWRINNVVVVEGYVSETTDTVAVLAPADQGVFPVRVDLYPYMPDGFLSDDLPPAASYEAELFVSDSPGPAQFDLAPTSSYFALYHLRGTFEDNGVRSQWFPSQEFSIAPDGPVTLAAEDGAFGYIIGPESALVSESVVWPVRDGVFSPVSFGIRLSIIEPGRVVAVASEAAGLFDVFAEEDGRIGLSVHESETIRSALPVFEFGIASTLTISVVPQPDAAEMTIYSDGIYVASESIPVDWHDVGVDVAAGPDGWSMISGRTTIGGNGLVALIDEFGVYFRDSANEPAADTALLLDRLEAEFADSLIYSEWFTEGDDSGVDLARDDFLDLPALEFSDESLVVGLELESGEGLQVEIVSADGGVTLHEIDIDPSQRSLWIARLSHSDGRLQFEIEGRETVNLGPQPEDFSGIVIRLRPTVSGRLYSAYARVEAAAVPRSVFDVSAAENR